MTAITTRRPLGATGLEISVLGFGCGIVGGLLVTGTDREIDHTIGAAIDLGITYFDTAPFYGNGRSEHHLGRALAPFRDQVVVGTKVMMVPPDVDDLEAVIARSIDESLDRLRVDQLDLVQLHNPVSDAPGGINLPLRTVADRVIPTFVAAREAGKVRAIGCSAHGSASATRELLEGGDLATMQVVYNLLNPSAVVPIAPGYPAVDYEQIATTAPSDVGAIGIRALAGGAMTGGLARHQTASATAEPIGSASRYEADVARAARFTAVIDAGYAESLVDLAVRDAVAVAELATVVIGFSSLPQVQECVAAIERGRLPAEAVELIEGVRQSFVGEGR